MDRPNPLAEERNRALTRVATLPSINETHTHTAIGLLGTELVLHTLYPVLYPPTPPLLTMKTLHTMHRDSALEPMP